MRVVGEQRFSGYRHRAVHYPVITALLRGEGDRTDGQFIDTDDVVRNIGEIQSLRYLDLDSGIEREKSFDGGNAVALHVGGAFDLAREVMGHEQAGHAAGAVFGFPEAGVVTGESKFKRPYAAQ